MLGGRHLRGRRDSCKGSDFSYVGLYSPALAWVFWYKGLVGVYVVCGTVVAVEVEVEVQ